ncbi:hypothetical protein EZS27_020530, partial [termite gut metagenome]
QYHPTLDNDMWWGKGFTEWTNVGKAKPLFKGHYQPKIPADLGYYDLRLPEVRETQAQMARKAGIEGFCYYHYWFGNGKQELELPFNEVLKLGKPDFPFCLCWANESWHAKFWNNKGGSRKKLLLEQKYLGKSDYIAHFNKLLPAFVDHRYISVEGKPVFVIYRPLDFPDISYFIELWNNLALKNGLKGIYFIGQTPQKNDINKIRSTGINAVNLVRLWEWLEKRTLTIHIKDKIRSTIFNLPNVHQYKDMINSFVGEEDYQHNVIPTIIPNWDHTPRSGRNGYVLNNSTPYFFSQHVKSVLRTLDDKPEDLKLLFLKSWNEWGEGNYMEPDLKYGHKYLDELAVIINM